MKEYTILTRDLGARIGVTEAGSGIPLVFLHGFSVSTKAYTEMLELLAANGFHVYGIDAPNHGRSGNLPWGHTVEDMVEVIADALGTLSVPRCILAGHSMGGWLAAELAAAYPDAAATVILLNATVGTEFHEAIKAETKPSLPFRAAQFVAGALKDVIGDARRAGSIRTLWERLDLASRLGSSVSGPGMWRAAYAMMQADSDRALKGLKRNNVRTVIVHGTEDRIVPQLSVLSAAVAACSRIVLLGGRYHSWMISDPELALQVIKDAVDWTDNEETA